MDMGMAAPQHSGVRSAAVPASAMTFAGEAGPVSRRVSGMRAKKMDASAEVAVDEPDGVGGQQGHHQQARMVIRTGVVNVIVQNITQSRDRITALVSSKNGYIATSSDHDGQSVLTVNIPVDDFDEVLMFVRDMGTKVLFLQTSGQDVTQLFVDSSARAKNLEAVHASLLKLIDKATVIQDILAVQRELTAITEQIEVQKAQVQYFSRSAAMSTATITLTAEYQGPSPQPTFDPIFTFDLGKSLHRALKIIGRVLSAILTGAVFVAVFSVPIAALLALLYSIDRRVGIFTKVVGASTPWFSSSTHAKANDNES